MILKVKTVDYAGWKLYSGISDLQYWSAPLERMKKMGCDGRFITNKSSRQTENTDKSEKRKSIPAVIVCVFRQRGFERSEERMNDQKMIIFDDTAYLLNDEGKTIERL